ncbi:uncharacterized protein LOC110819090 [Carica papaya]|uniref:uncharacterized protein LOC110819090 n=1 Tax=Carica papaya TaxID=3649 RepID=UPI000B8CD7B9|nr:uncharacterized protein LOC110819090 [Carica papaya]
MAASLLSRQPSFHTRSNSFPSRRHPLTSQIDEHLCRVRSSRLASTSSSSINNKLNDLQDLHECVNRLLQLPLTQQALAQEQYRNWGEAILDGSLRLLDVCCISKDLLLQTKESTHELQSILRRRGGEVSKCMATRKTIMKAINKAWENIKATEAKSRFLSSTDNESMAVVSTLKEVESDTLSFFESLLSFMSGNRFQSKIKGWPLVSKLMQPKRIMFEESDSEVNEFQKVNTTLNSLVGHRSINFEKLKHSENLLNQLKDLELCIQDLEDRLECLARHLFKTRVFLLNILNH